MKPGTGGFIAGTLVWTEAGPIAIEQIKEGDRVLSRSEDGMGDTAYRSVVRTLRHGEKTVVAVMYADSLSSRRSGTTFATDDHRFWVEGRGWVVASELREGDELRRHDGTALFAQLVSPVYATRQHGIGWFSLSALTADTIGNVIDFNGPVWELVASHVHHPTGTAHGLSRLLVEVYNVEVHDHRTYHVGSKGVWVHNERG